MPMELMGCSSLAESSPYKHEAMRPWGSDSNTGRKKKKQPRTQTKKEADIQKVPSEDVILDKETFARKMSDGMNVATPHENLILFLGRSTRGGKSRPPAWFS